MIVLPALPAPVDQLWHVLMDLADRVRIPWTLVGGQMVLLHAVEHGAAPPQVSQDGDVVADLRASPSALSSLVAFLERADFVLDGLSSDGIAHRYRRPADPQPVRVDLLGPEGLGPRADLTTSRPGRTVEMPGGTQALARTERVLVAHEGREGEVPRPDLLGAVVAKSAACALPGSARHYRDLALLLAVVPDPFAVRERLTGKDRQRIAAADGLQDPLHPAWQLLDPELRRTGIQAREVLLG